ncbi:MAG: amidophosphoribosyltransferase [Candidatus Kaiserbacteria bacterium]|nr:amidophosphoribosyltransferase [Candidatus Kaiserbacteria bacterium]
MCGIFAVYNMPKAAELAVIGLHGIQHRAIDYAGVTSFDRSGNPYFEYVKGVARNFKAEALNRLHGRYALGHIRYPTVADDPTRINIQPVRGSYGKLPIVLAHNGNLTNVSELRNKLEERRNATSMDTEYILHLLAHHHTGDIEKDLQTILPLLKGSYALVVMLPQKMIAIRDASGNRPLSIGSKDQSHFVSSETCVFPTFGVDTFFDVPAGSMCVITSSSIRTIKFAEPDLKICPFELIYFAHPSSSTFGVEVDQFRINIGRELARLFPVDVDVVMDIPDSSKFIALGYAQGTGTLYHPGIIRSHYVGRTFIAATQALRDLDVAQKFSFTRGAIQGKRIAVVDDSIVRGTTGPKIVNMLKTLGAKEVHFLVGSPPIKKPCYYGINTPEENELLAAHHSAEQIRVQMGATSLHFLPLISLKQLLPDGNGSCFACMDGKYWH